MTLTEYSLPQPGGQLCYWLAGVANAPLIIFTHGAAMDHRMFAAQVTALTDRYRLLLWDVPGHGQSRPYTDPFSVRGAAEALLALLDHLGYEHACLVGHSMGGYISQELLFYYPERVTALVTIGSTCLTLAHPPLIAWTMRLSPRLLRGCPYRLFIRPVARYITVTPAARAYVREVVGRHTKPEFIAIWSTVMNCLHPEPGYQITQPVLVTHGQHDQLGFGLMKQQARCWTARDQNSRYVVIPAAVHNAHQENPDFFNRILLDFLTEIQQSTVLEKNSHVKSETA